VSLITPSKLSENTIAEKTDGGPTSAPRSPASIEELVEIIKSMRTEVSLVDPNSEGLMALVAESQSTYDDLVKQMIENLQSMATTLTSGNPDDARLLTTAAAEIKEIGEDIVRRANQKTAEIQQASARAAAPGSVDNLLIDSDDVVMSDPTREEIDAKLDAREARMDGRVASIEAKIDGFIGRLDERFARMDDRMTHIEASTSQTQSAIGNLKTTTIITAVSTVLAIVLGVAAFNATVLSNMVASFESGKATSAAQAEVKRQSEETAALLRQLQQSMPPPPRK
jgi:ABC-type multidrug transport system fused ATPase/permease subunit